MTDIIEFFLVPKLYLGTSLFEQLCFVPFGWQRKLGREATGNNTKRSFSDRDVPKYNFGTKGKPQRKSPETAFFNDLLKGGYTEIQHVTL